jgi:hypothetical protein
MKRYMTGRNLILVAIVVVALALAWNIYQAKRNPVLDPSNSKTVSDLFDQLNPTLANS